MKRKYELNNFEPYQFADIRDHLEAMALRGWRLERMERYFLVYRRESPNRCAMPWYFIPRWAIWSPPPLRRGRCTGTTAGRPAGSRWPFGVRFPKSRSTAMRSPTPSPSRPTGPFSGG